MILVSKVKEDESGNRVRIIYDRDRGKKVMEWLNKDDLIHHDQNDQPARISFVYNYDQNQVCRLYKKEWYYGGVRDRVMRDENGKQLPAYFRFEKYPHGLNQQTNYLKSIRYYRRGQLHRSFFDGPAVINYIYNPEEKLSFKYVDYWYKGKYYPFIFNFFVMLIILLLYCGVIFLFNYCFVFK